MPYKNIKDKLANNNKWRSENKDKVLKSSKSRWSDPIKRRKSKISRIRRVYKAPESLAEDIYDTMICEICGQPVSFDTQTDGLKKACVDHCHKSGHIRGVLCSNCNAGIGYADDNIRILENMIRYLKKINSL